ncbi:hypothetical protein M231_07625 [Tremella mesenterica]|uniref:Short-chain dehydrogenase n=1 Tax=Tremella mesenterica TaxID=5217 RepID=A0A4Q1B8M9_TREME|nr:uncharacterized protein TREMEDRAFT_69877 [Tremella mesenterica DSM 1558]EIW66876.1 hypothetical protein TREMEDRAFT_69877 [Tremella mesenterica DSM 1558]RXK35108.1 hypothetical protein M231_07625 [Tremella mesenterica]
MSSVPPTDPDAPPSAACRVLITGANSGLGLALARALLDSSEVYHVMLACRSLEKGHHAIAQLNDEFQHRFADGRGARIVVLDVNDDDSLRRAYHHVLIKEQGLDILVNNAGAQFDHLSVSGQMSIRESFTQTLAVHVSSPHVVTNTFAPLLIESTHPLKAVLFVSSRSASLANHEAKVMAEDQAPGPGWPKSDQYYIHKSKDDNNHGPGLIIPAYRTAKCAESMLVREWARVLENDHVRVFGVSPGLLVTNLGKGAAFLSRLGGEDAMVGGVFLREVIEGSRDKDVGKVVGRKGVQPW